MQDSVPVVGLAGGIASGKSCVADYLGELGAAVIDADRINHEVLAEPAVRDRIKQWWGADTYSEDGQCNRAKLAEIVFRHPDQIRRLEELTHPRVEDRRRTVQAELLAQPTTTVVVLNIPLLFEVGADRDCQVIIFVDCSQEMRIARARATRGWDAAELMRRENLQWPLEWKRTRADYIVENHADLNSLRRQVETIYRQLVAPKPCPAE
ncbi:MAG: Dephospho-CoA kinase [Phycisphaerae bacterium]|nr:Dephospho-CoA kinase [Phycisphaerae bacterium]